MAKPEAKLPSRRTLAALTGPQLQHPSPSSPGAPPRRQLIDADASDCTAPPRPTGSAQHTARSSTARPPGSSCRPQLPAAAALTHRSVVMRRQERSRAPGEKCPAATFPGARTALPAAPPAAAMR
jgi:hypothetical protein